jgi:hypothetical protein
MARKKITINHPTQTDPATSPTFVAFGDAVGVQNVVGLVLHPKKGLIPGTTLVGPPNWGIFFEKVPNGDCILLVFDPLDWTTLAFSRFTLKAAKAAKGMMALAGGTITINYPSPGATVCSNFIAYGTGDVANITGTMTDHNGNVITGTTIQNRNGVWAIQFNIPTPFNNDYTLTVTGTGAAPASVTPLTVQSCP